MEEAPLHKPVHAHSSRRRTRTLKLIHLSLVAGLLLLIMIVMRPFIVPLLWSVIFAILLLPVFHYLNQRLSLGPRLAASIVTGGFFAIFVLAIFPLLWHLGYEAVSALRSFESISADELRVWLKKTEAFPLIGPVLAPYLVNTFDLGFIETLKTYHSSWLSLATTALANTASLLFGGFFAILSLYFILVNSPTLVRQLRHGALTLGGASYLGVLISIYETVRATLHGMLLTSLTQGILAGIAYFAAGTPFPVLLTMLTAFASLVPFGPPLVYLPLAVVMAVEGASWIKIVLFVAWGVGVVSTADNLLRPFFISRSTHLSFLLVLFGIIGGILGFGAVGVFIGPVTIVLASHLWTELLKKDPLQTLT